MKENEFVKKFGLVKTRKLVQGYPNTTTYKFYDYYFDSSSGEYVSVSLSQLKRLVESHELVESCGGLDKAKKKLSTEQSEPYYNYSQQLVDSLKQAIADVESCQ